MNAHQRFFEELRTAREAKGMTLEDISRATLIDLKYLTAIEEAREDVLPAAYLRAFIREYATTIGLDPAVVMNQYDQTPPSVAGTGSSAHTTETMQPAPIAGEPHRAWWTNRVALLTAMSAGIVCIIAIVLYFSRSFGPSPVREIPFSTAVSENERRVFPGDTAKAAPSAAPVASGDSLLLSAASVDSVWMQLSIDGTPANDYLFPPNVRRRWKAKEKFTISLGNAGGMIFRLNSTDIGTLGKRGSILRNYELNRRSLTSPTAGRATP
jgi:transcriptional regulator with XRE-family HTH domain